MIISRVVGNCPSCGSAGFGNVLIGSNVLLRGCNSCGTKVRLPLPPITKKIIYLDQSFLSAAFHGKDDRYAAVLSRLRNATACQLLVAPYSSVHETETHQWRGFQERNRAQLMDFIKQTSGGHAFKPDYDVHRAQVHACFQTYLEGGEARATINPPDALKNDIHDWDGYLSISVGRYSGDVELVRALKARSVEGLVDLFSQWRTSVSSFDDDVVSELRAAAVGYCEAYEHYANRIARGDIDALIDSPVISMVVEQLLRALPQSTDLGTRVSAVADYFRSPHFACVPYHDIGTRVFALLKQRVRAGAYPDRANAIRELGGFFFDVEHIATYAPYCDAIVVDRAMAALVLDKRVDLAARFQVRVFSVGNWDDLIEWLDQLVLSMSKEHKVALDAIHPGAY